MTAGRACSVPLTRRRLLAGAACFAATATLAEDAAPGRPALRTASRPGTAFGTTVALTVLGADERALEHALDAAFAEIRLVEAVMSLFDSRSDLARLNEAGFIDDPHPSLLELVAFSLALARDSDGAFDPTVQPLWSAWQQARAAGGRPTDPALREARSRVNWRAVEIGAGRIAFAEPGMAMTLNGIAQGFAADRVVAALGRLGVHALFVDTGEFAARGRRSDGAPWALGIAHPRRPAEVIETVRPFAGFAATSGDYETTFSADFADNHIFDPATGRSPLGLASVTVEAPSGALADGLSTAAFVLGPEKGARLVARWPGTRMHAVAKDGASVTLLPPVPA
jgi:FAD:protein FMN transferase